ncbi:MAG: hypothetical protein HFE63_10295 [Clostridiales bacterium]|nr:hypothetical protein [Clostridiales bacterium]
MPEQRRKNPTEKAAECVRAYHTTGEATDVLGSYTGIFRSEIAREPGHLSLGVYTPDTLSLDGIEVPVQDADDL